MREQLIQYVTLLFAGAQDCADTKQEILQNTLDRYDDLVAQGKSPEAAYRLAIGGIGDINEILAAEPETAALRQPAKPETEVDEDTLFKKILRAAAIGVELCFVAERAHTGKPFRQILLQRGFPAGKHNAIEKPGPFFQESKHLRLGKKRRIAQNMPVVAIEAAVVAARGKNHRRKAAGKIHRAEFF